MALNKIVVPPFKDPQLLNFAKQVQELSRGTGTQTGNGNPVRKASDVTGATYWDSKSNNFWIFREGNWEQLDQGLRVDKDTGQVYQSDTGAFYGWYFKYLAVKFADTETGGGISDYPTNKSYYGYRNSDDPTESVDPTKYLWSNVDIPGGTFGTTKFLYYETTGGRRYKMAIALVNGQPEGNYTTTPVDAIDMDKITSAIGPVAITGEQVIRYSNSINGVTDYATLPTNRQFIGYWSKAEYDMAGPAEKENPFNYTWKILPAVPGPMDSVFFTAGQQGSIDFAVGTSPPDPTKYTDLGYQGDVNNPVLNPQARSGYVVTKLIGQSGGGGIGYQQANSPVAGSGDVSIALPFVGQQGTFDVRIYPFLTVDQYGRVAAVSQSNESIEYFLSDKHFYQRGATNVITLNHVPTQIMVYLNGVLLGPADYTEGTAVNNISPTITIPGWTAGNVTVYRFRKVLGFTAQLDTSPFTRVDTTIATDMLQFPLPAGIPNQTEILFINGAQVPDIEYTYVTVGGVTYLDLTGAEFFRAGSTITLIAFANVNTVPKFNQGGTDTVIGQTMFTFLNAPRPNNIIPTPLTYQLALTANGVLIDETTTTPVFTGDYTWPLGSRTMTLTSPALASQEPLQYTVWISDLTYPA